jgi:signal peptidase I
MIEGREHLIREMQEELFQKQGQGWFRIMSGSMRPLIDIDDKVLAKLVDPEEVKPGDIILFKNTDALVTHRVVKVIRHNGKTMILQRGDAGLELFSIVLSLSKNPYRRIGFPAKIDF